MREELRQAKRVIVKVGTSSLTHAKKCWSDKFAI